MITQLDGRSVSVPTLKRTQRVLKICDSCGHKSTPQWRHALDSQKKWNKDLCGQCARSKNNQPISLKHGRKKKSGKDGDYIMVWDKRHNKYVGEHQLVMEENTGFQIIGSKYIKIHHINGVKDDNRIENLVATEGDKEHRQIHCQLERISFELVRRGIILFDRFKKEYYISPAINLATLPISLGFEDVAIRQQKAKIATRSEAIISAPLIRGIELKIPLIAANMSTVTNIDFCILLEKLGSLGVLHRAAPDEKLEQWTSEIAKKNSRIAVSVGVGISQLNLAKKLIRRNANIIFIDVAHGYSDPVIDMVRKIKKFAPAVHIIAGNTTNPGLFGRVSEFASAVKVGIAQGFACETKNTAGVTEKQFSAIQKCLAASRSYGLPIISDGGIREPADFVKAIGGGASAVMAGKIFAACPESAAPLNEHGKKIYAGMASRFVQEKWHGRVKNDTPEGGIRYLEPGEPAEKLIKRYAGALRSAISYSGASNIKEFQTKVEFIKIQSKQ